MGKRQYKFRAWSKVEHKMCDVQILTDQGCFLLGLKPGKDQITDNGKFIVEAPKDGRFCPFQEIELMQFTGLKDKNSKKIYEGDLLNTKTTFENNMADRRFQPDTLRKASFENGIFIDEFSGMPLFNKIYSPVSHKIEYEIVGNIYENPELL